MLKQDLDLFVQKDRIFVRRTWAEHRDEKGELYYDELHIDTQLKMQREHFWYLGRHRFLLRVLKKELQRLGDHTETLSVIDLGGGCGGWLEYLQKRSSIQFKEVALGDSSYRALHFAQPIVSSFANCYQVDLLDLGWTERWDVVFLLDVLEHIPEDVTALSQIQKSLRPRGLLLITAPALNFFWSNYDEMVEHQRRYSRSDFVRLASETGLNLILSRYFMFFLSPLVYLSRSRDPDVKAMTRQQILQELKHTHRVPTRPVNEILRVIFSIEASLGLWLPFPWGTSILTVLQKT
jgi:2-polyprenyl-3-methyl-5-hydroxy-6-metoxy-1,4-benzoquinol methylase